MFSRILTTSRGFSTGTFPISIQGNRLCADEFSFKLRLTVLEKHSNNFTKIFVEFVQSFTLRMSTGKPGNIADKKSRFNAFLDYCRIVMHVNNLRCRCSCRFPAGRFEIFDRFLHRSFESIVDGFLFAHRCENSGM